MKNFFVYIPMRDDWGNINNHRIRGYLRFNAAKRCLDKFNDGHITNQKDLFVLIKQRGQIIYHQEKYNV